MDKIILASKDVEALLKWRDENTELVRRNAAPFKGILLDFPETKIRIKAYNNAGKIDFYIEIGGKKAGKISGQQMPGGLFRTKKNTTKLKSDDIQSIITVYASLMALIVYHEPERSAAPPRRQAEPKKAKRNPRKNGITYLLKAGASGPQVQPRGHHASPAGVFSVRGHYRHYKDGRTVWIKPYQKGKGQQKTKTYRL